MVFGCWSENTVMWGEPLAQHFWTPSCISCLSFSCIAARKWQKHTLFTPPSTHTCVKIGSRESRSNPFTSDKKRKTPNSGLSSLVPVHVQNWTSLTWVLLWKSTGCIFCSRTSHHKIIQKAPTAGASLPLLEFTFKAVSVCSVWGNTTEEPPLLFTSYYII